MRRGAGVVLLAAALLCAGCGGENDSEADEADEPIGGGLALKVTMDPERVRSGSAVTWSLEVVNAGVEATKLTFPTSQRGNIVLRRRGRTAVAYRWSAGRFFSESVIEDRLRPNDRETYRLEERRLPLPAGDYDLEATLKASPAPDPVRRRIKVLAGATAVTTTSTQGAKLDGG